MFKFCILAAGKGTRNTSIEGLHKSLLPVSNRAAISKILEKIPKEVPVVIAVGHKSEQVVTYCSLVHSDRDIDFVKIENFDGPGAGPGLSLLSCKSKLNCPFIFTSADTILEPGEKIDFTLEENWVGTARVSSEESYKYCLFDGSRSKNDRFYFKCNTSSDAFIGIAGVKDYEDFWKGLSEKDLIKDEHQVLNGLRYLDKISQHDLTWYDTGNVQSYEKTKSRFPNDVVIEKNNEVIFIDNGWVVKYFSNQKKLSDRVRRTEQLFSYVPKVIKINENMMAYQFIEGVRLSDVYDENVLSYFLTDYYKNFVKADTSDDNESFLLNCDEMYFQKTQSRVEGFVGSPIDRISKINGVSVKPIREILLKIDWNKIQKKSVPTCFHGDLQPENIIYSSSPTKRFFYIDWRETFGKSIETGDMYYDLGKLYHALVISNSLVLEGNYSVKIDYKDDHAEIYFAIKNNLLNLNKILEVFCKRNELDYRHVKLLGILNYLNIACLYDNFENGDYGRFLFLLGKKMLTEWIDEEQNEPIKSN